MAANRVFTITEFRANGSAILNEVAASNRSVTITRHGKPMVVIGPVPTAANFMSARDSLAGKNQGPRRYRKHRRLRHVGHRQRPAVAKVTSGQMTTSAKLQSWPPTQS